MHRAIEVIGVRAVYVQPTQTEWVAREMQSERIN